MADANEATGTGTRDIDRQQAVRRGPSSGGLGLLLATGVGVFSAGVIAIGLSLALAHAAAWRFGMTATMVGEGVLILGLVAMAARQWQSSGRLTRQLDGVDRQLDNLRSAARRVDGSDGVHRAPFGQLELV